MIDFSDKIKRIVRGVIAEAIFENKVNSITFTLDDVSRMTLHADTDLVNESNNWILRRKNWEINNYKRFLEIIDKTPKKFKGYLTYHVMDEITGEDWVTYCLKGADVAFALHYIEPGKIDICNFVNNSELRGIGKEVLQFAKSEGATQMDNYRGFPSENDPQGHGKLGNLYRDNGFDKQTWHSKFNADYQPSDPE